MDAMSRLGTNRQFRTYGLGWNERLPVWESSETRGNKEAAEMPTTQSAGVVRKFITRTLAAGTLLAIYAVGTIVTTGTMLTASTTSAEAQWRGRGRRGWGRGRGWGRRGWGRRGWRGGLVCRHRYYSSRRVCFYR
jgi:hypothetical protein